MLYVVLSFRINRRYYVRNSNKKYEKDTKFCNDFAIAFFDRTTTANCRLICMSNRSTAAVDTMQIGTQFLLKCCLHSSYHYSSGNGVSVEVVSFVCARMCERTVMRHWCMRNGTLPMNA